MTALATLWFYLVTGLVGAMVGIIVAFTLFGMWSVGLAAWDMWRDRQGRAVG